MTPEANHRTALEQLVPTDELHAPADETIRRLHDERWEPTALAAVRRDREADSQGWAKYLAAADELAAADAPIADEWHSK